jgi:hypothetical protein
MRHSLCLSVLLAFAAFAGYTAATTPVRAQGEAVPFQQGDIVTFSFQDGDSRQCRIEQIHGTFARCGNVSNIAGSTIGRSEPPEAWVNVAVVEWVTKSRERK